MSVVQGALDYVLDRLGCAYSQAKRWNVKPDIFDCSSLIYRGFRDGGYTFVSGSTSTTMVNDENFSLLWPESRGVLGKQFSSVAALKKAGYGPRPGDIIYLCTNSATSRSNKITHVAMVVNENVIVHARGSSYGVRQDAIDLYGTKVVAVTRFPEEGEKAVVVCGARCTGDGVNIRVGPATSYKAVGKLYKGDPLVAESTGRDWALVATVKDGAPLSGYMSAKYIEGV